MISALRGALAAEGLPEDCVQMVPDTSRETANEMMRLNGYLDVLIPRGGAGLINSVVQNSTVPVIQTGVVNCHVFVDESADLEKAARIVINAKTQRPGVCNACESLLVHEAIAEKFMPEIGKALQERKVEIRGDEATQGLVSGAVPATEADWGNQVARGLYHFRKGGKGYCRSHLPYQKIQHRSFRSHRDGKLYQCTAFSE